MAEISLSNIEKSILHEATKQEMQNPEVANDWAAQKAYQGIEKANNLIINEIKKLLNNDIETAISYIQEAREDLDYVDQTINNKFGPISTEKEAVEDVMEQFEEYVSDLEEVAQDTLEIITINNADYEQLLQTTNNFEKDLMNQLFDDLEKKSKKTTEKIADITQELREKIKTFVNDSKEDILYSCDKVKSEMNNIMIDFHKDIAQINTISMEKIKKDKNKLNPIIKETPKNTTKIILNIFKNKKENKYDLQKNVNKLYDKMICHYNKVNEKYSEKAQTYIQAQNIIKDFWKQKGNPLKGIDNIIKAAEKAAEIDNRNIMKDNPLKDILEL